MERSLRDLGLAAFDPYNCKFDLSGCLFTNELHMHVLIQIGKVSLRKRKTGLNLRSLFAFVDLYL